MKILRFLIPISAGLLLVCNSCKNDFELNAPYKEIPSVYAVLDPEASLHMIRINKIFLGEGDANQMAQVADSINYPAGELSVTLIHSAGQQITFRDSMIQTESGAFNSNQRVYCSNDKLLTSGTYTLQIKNNHTGNVFIASSKAILPLGLKSPSPNSTFPPFNPLYYPVPDNAPLSNYVDYSEQNKSYTIRYYPSDAKIYQLLIRMHYYDSLGDGNKNYTYLDYTFGNQYLKDKVTTGVNNGFLITSFKGSELFSAAGVAMSKVPANSLLLGRKMYKIQFFIFSSTQEYLDYLEYSKPSLNIAQNKPIYSNFVDQAAIGIFTFRCGVSVEKSMSSTFISAFASNPNTCPYQFYNTNLAQPPCNP